MVIESGTQQNSKEIMHRVFFSNKKKAQLVVWCGMQQERKPTIHVPIF